MFDKRLLAMVPGARKYVVADVLLQWAALAANIFLYFLIGTFLQAVWRGTQTPALFVELVAAALAAIAVRLVCQALAQRAGQAAAFAAKRTVRREVYDKLVRLGPSYREKVATSEAVQVSVEGVEQLEAYFGSYLPQLVYALLASLTLFACLTPLCLPAAVVLLVLIPLIPVSIMAVQRIAKRTMRSYWGSYTDLGSMFLESIQGLTTLKIYQADGRRHELMNDEAETFRKATMRLLTMQLNSITVMDLFAFGGAAAGIIVMLVQFAAGSVTFAGAFTFALLAAEFFLPLRALGSFVHTAMNGMAAAEKMYAILDAPEPPAGSRTVDPADASIVCRGVGYSYDGERMVLADVDFAAPRGSFVGVTGESGSGKSTLAGVLTGANASYSGSVTVGGVELRDLSRASLRSTITYVPFNGYLFEGTVRSNLQLAKANASDDELWDVLTRCRIDGFVRAAGGLDAVVASEGSNLSGGQRQRLVVARALLHDTPVYVFDEATSNIDAQSEAAILDSIQELAQTKTVVMISHRLFALRDADRIYVFENGRVAQAGTHADLAAADGPYGRLWAEQARLEEIAAGQGPDSAAALDALADEDRFAAENPAAPQGFSPTAPEPGTAEKALGPESPRRRSGLSVMLRLVGLVRPLVPVMVLAVVLGVLGFLAAIFLTVFAVFGIVGVSGAWRVMGLTAVCVLIAVCGLVRGPLRYGEQICNHYLAFKILALVRDRVFAAMRRLAPAKLEGKGKGNLVSLVTADVELLEVFYAHTLSPAIIALVVSVVMLCFIGAQSVRLVPLAAVAYLAVGVVIPLVSSKTVSGSGRGVRDGIGAMNGFVLESLRGLATTLQFGHAEERARELDRRTEELAATERRLKGRTALWMAITGAVVLGFDILMLVCAMAMVGQGTLVFGKAVLAVAALMASFGPVIAVANLGTTLQQTLASGARVLDLLDERPQVEEVADGAELGEFTGAALRGVDFGYNGERVLSDVSLHVEPGSVVRIAGRSGSGKSTLLKLLMRFWDVDRGVVEVSGHDVRCVNTASLRATEGFMTQETHLFAGTIRENLALVKPDATDEELMAAVEKAALLDLVERLPQGLDTPVGELGDTLSGGERQRLGLARVFLHDAPFVLLDEPTSNLDALNEAQVLRALAGNRAGKTVVLVSHRESAAAVCDVTYSVERGRLS